MLSVIDLVLSRFTTLESVFPLPKDCKARVKSFIKHGVNLCHSIELKDEDSEQLLKKIHSSKSVFMLYAGILANLLKQKLNQSSLKLTELANLISDTNKLKSFRSAAIDAYIITLATVIDGICASEVEDASKLKSINIDRLVNQLRKSPDHLKQYRMLIESNTNPAQLIETAKKKLEELERKAEKGDPIPLSDVKDILDIINNLILNREAKSAYELLKRLKKNLLNVVYKGNSSDVSRIQRALRDACTYATSEQICTITGQLEIIIEKFFRNGFVISGETKSDLHNKPLRTRQATAIGLLSKPYTEQIKSCLHSKIKDDDLKKLAKMIQTIAKSINLYYRVGRYVLIGVWLGLLVAMIVILKKAGYLQRWRDAVKPKVLAAAVQNLYRTGSYRMRILFGFMMLLFVLLSIWGAYELYRKLAKKPDIRDLLELGERITAKEENNESK